ncbi:hypothetical protein DRJ25_06110 [Candidatus Woesearchaeota archaeon]|nr:MAG: hypothetical protein DRJ25_06110 [Candidatus Woesearchaeota archaeon]
METQEKVIEELSSELDSMFDRYVMLMQLDIETDVMHFEKDSLHIHISPLSVYDKEKCKWFSPSETKFSKFQEVLLAKVSSLRAVRLLKDGEVTDDFIVIIGDDEHVTKSMEVKP